MPMRIGTPMPELAGVTEWLNGAQDRQGLIGFPVLIFFWSVSCPTCIESVPKIAVWREQYAAHGLKVIGIHVPRMEADTEVSHVREEAAALGITEPCGIDNLHAVMGAFDNEFVPAYFLFNREGKLAGRTGGHHGVSLMEAPLKRLLDADPDGQLPVHP